MIETDRAKLARYNYLSSPVYAQVIDDLVVRACPKGTDGVKVNAATDFFVFGTAMVMQDKDGSLANPNAYPYSFVFNEDGRAQFIGKVPGDLKGEDIYLEPDEYLLLKPKTTPVPFDALVPERVVDLAPWLYAWGDQWIAAWKEIEPGLDAFLAR